MKTELFNDLYACITEGIPEDTITEPEFLYYIIGYNSKNYKNHISYDKLSEKIVRRLLKGTVTLYSIFANEYFYILEMSKELKLDDFFYLHLKNNPPAARKVRENITCKDQILSLYNMHQLCIPPKKKTEELLINLFTACIMENVNFFSSYIKTLPKPDTLKSILGRENDAYILKDKIKQHHKIIISAQHGMGKTAFIKYCLSSWKLQDFCYISYKDDLHKTLEEIKYTKNFRRKYFQKFDNLIREAKPNSLLVIDNMQYSKNLDHDLKELANLPINVIVILPNSVSITSFYNFKLSPLSDDLLKEIFKSFSNYFFIENSFWDKLFFVTQKNILIISLVAQQCRIIHSKTHEKSSASMKTISNNILSRLTTLERDESGKNPSPFSLYKFKHIYDSKTLDIIGHAKLIYKTLSNEINMSLKGFLEHLCLFGLEPVPYDFLSIIVPSFSKENLDKLSEMSFLVLLDETVQLNPLFCHLIIAETKPSPEQYVLIIDRLTNFLENYDKELSIPYLSDILFTFIQLLYPHVKRINNPNQKSTSSIFNKWQDLLYLTVYYYHQCGNFQVAEKITSMIQYPDLISFHSSLDQSLLLLENNIRSKYDPEKISEKLQEIEKSVTKKTPNIQCLHYHLSCIAQCNFMIGFYCYFQIYIMHENKNMFNYLNKLPKLMNYHLYSSNSCMRHEFASLPKEQLKYFELSNKMMDAFSFNYASLHFSYFEYNFSYFKESKRMNIRISGMAFTLFMYSLFLFTKLNYKFGSTAQNDDIASFFQSHIFPMIETLQNQIRNCKLIPRDTFQLYIFAHLMVKEIQRRITSFVEEKGKPSIIEIHNIKNLFDHIFLSEKEKNIYKNDKSIHSLK